MSTQKVYLLQHSRTVDENADDVKIIGVFESRHKAECTISNLITKEGFRDYPNDFYIDEYVLNKQQWSDGFFVDTN